MNKIILFNVQDQKKVDALIKVPREQKSTKRPTSKAQSRKKDEKSQGGDLPWVRGPLRISFLTTFGFLPNPTFVGMFELFFVYFYIF